MPFCEQCSFPNLFRLVFHESNSGETQTSKHGGNSPRIVHGTNPRPFPIRIGIRKALQMDQNESIFRNLIKICPIAVAQESVDSFEKQLASMSDVIQGRLNAIHGDMAVAGMSRTTIPEEGDEDLGSQ